MCKFLMSFNVLSGRRTNAFGRFLDLALVCELKGDLKMAEVTAAKAVEVKQDCQGDDFPEFGKYEEVLKRIRVKLGAVAA